MRTDVVTVPCNPSPRFRCQEVVLLEDLLNARMDGIEKCTELARAALDRQVVTNVSTLEKSHQAAAITAEKSAALAAVCIITSFSMPQAIRPVE